MSSNPIGAQEKAPVFLLVDEGLVLKTKAVREAVVRQMDLLDEAFDAFQKVIASDDELIRALAGWAEDIERRRVDVPAAAAPAMKARKPRKMTVKES